MIFIMYNQYIVFPHNVEYKEKLRKKKVQMVLSLHGIDWALNW